jgi:hypothetical protein
MVKAPLVMTKEQAKALKTGSLQDRLRLLRSIKTPPYLQPRTSIPLQLLPSVVRFRMQVLVQSRPPLFSTRVGWHLFHHQHQFRRHRLDRARRRRSPLMGFLRAFRNPRLYQLYFPTVNKTRRKYWPHPLHLIHNIVQKHAT